VVTLENKKDIIAFFLSRRSHSAKSLELPIPGASDIQTILTAAARTPDHGKLEPWRFLVIKKNAMLRISKEITKFGILKELDEEKLEKNVNTFVNAPLIIGVVFSPRKSDRIPIIEQQLSAGAVCLALLNAAHALGWGANWLTGWMSYDEKFLTSALGLKTGEFVAGFIHIGTPKQKTTERPRPEIANLTTHINS
jgi:nitroreductase